MRRRRAAKTNAFGGPCIANIDDPSVLHDTRRLLEIWTTEKRRGAVRCTPRQFIAAACRASRHGDAPVALFAALVNREEWDYIHDDEWAEAGDRLEAHDPARRAAAFDAVAAREAERLGVPVAAVTAQMRRALATRERGAG